MFKSYWKRSFSRKDLISLISRLEMYISAGLSLSASLFAVAEHMGSSKELLDSICRSVENGTKLSHALNDKISLPSAVRCIIEHGESSGRLVDALKESRHILEKKEELIKKALSSSTYPAVIGIFSVILVISLMRGIVPQMKPLLDGLDMDLPMLTRIVLWVSESIISYGIYALGFIFLMMFSFVYLYKKKYFWRKFVHVSISKFPIVSRLIFDYQSVLFLNSLGYLLGAGVPLVKAYRDACYAVSLIPLQEYLLANADELSRGTSIVKILESSGFKDHTIALVSAGLGSGALSNSLIRSASLIEGEIDETLKRASVLLEPSLMVGMGTVVGCVALSMMMPIYEISKTIQTRA